jgi:hypothetical protein
MKLKVTKFKTLAGALKELEPFIRHGLHLRTGKPFKGFGGLRSRELLGNWLICVAANQERGNEAFTFTSDPGGGDGIIYDLEHERPWPTEHVMVLVREGEPKVAVEAGIVAAVEAKQAKGAAYAKGKTLVVFDESGGGEWHPVKAARRLPPNDFDEVWVVSPYGVEEGCYVYSVVSLAIVPAPIWIVTITADFSSWIVARRQ